MLTGSDRQALAIVALNPAPMTIWSNAASF